jgi:putative membrane protein
MEIDKYYEWIKVFHIVFMTAWMAGLFYLPRLFANHIDAVNNKQMYSKFLTMEKKLITIIMTPAMILTVFLGLLLASIYGFLSLGPWFHLKLLCVTLLLVQHFYWIHCYRNFKKNKNKRKPVFYKALGEITTIFFVIIVIAVVIKPFEG